MPMNSEIGNKNSPLTCHSHLPNHCSKKLSNWQHQHLSRQTLFQAFGWAGCLPPPARPPGSAALCAVGETDQPGV